MSACLQDNDGPDIQGVSCVTPECPDAALAEDDSGVTCAQNVLRGMKRARPLWHSFHS